MGPQCRMSILRNNMSLKLLFPNVTCHYNFETLLHVTKPYVACQISKILGVKGHTYFNSCDTWQPPTHMLVLRNGCLAMSNLNIEGLTVLHVEQSLSGLI